MGFAAIVNTPGYLPWDDEPAVFETARAAWEYLADQRTREEDEMFDPETDPDDYTDTRETLCALATEQHWSHSGTAGWLADHGLAPDGTGVVYGDTPGYSGDHDQGLAYSVTYLEDPVSELQQATLDNLPGVKSITFVEE